MKKIIFTVLKVLGTFVGLILIYIICGLLLPFIKISPQKVGEPKTITAYILTNGVHTDLVLPIKSEEIDWSQEISFENTKSKRTDYNYLSVGWGDKGFYLETPTWADLKVSTALKAAFWMSESAMHCTFYEKMTEGADCKKIMLTKTQYLSLISFIQNKFDRDQNGKPILIKTDAVYDTNDAFYDAKGSYSFLYTCNTWANDGLKAAGQEAAFWTPTDFGIFQHYK